MSALRKPIAVDIAHHRHDAAVASGEVVCPHCGTEFVPGSRHITPLGSGSGRRSASGLLLALLVHALLLYFVLRPHPNPTGSAAQQGELVYMMPIAPQKAAKHPAPAHHDKPKTDRRPTHPRPPTAIHETPLPPPIATAPPSPEVITEPTDIMSMINAARERRRASDAAIAQQNAEEGDTGATNFAAENLKRDLQNRLRSKAGTNGMFRILSKGVRNAQFSFRGWTTDARDNWKHVYEVDAGPNGDVERTIVRRMIDIIREHYQGDFNWESHRLGRVIVMSARQADQKELEEFLLLEFFQQ